MLPLDFYFHSSLHTTNPTTEAVNRQTDRQTDRKSNLQTINCQLIIHATEERMLLEA